MNAADVGHRLRQIMAKVETGKLTTAEDVHLAALAWAVEEHPDEAAAGHATGSDVQLVQVARANRIGGDAAAQTVCDAAHAWRAATRLDQGPRPAAFRTLLARAVDHHEPSWWRRNRLRVAMALGFTSGFSVGAEGVMELAGWGPSWLRGLALALAFVCLLAFAGVMAQYRRSFDR